MDMNFNKFICILYNFYIINHSFYYIEINFVKFKKNDD